MRQINMQVDTEATIKTVMDVENFLKQYKKTFSINAALDRSIKVIYIAPGMTEEFRKDNTDIRDTITNLIQFAFQWPLWLELLHSDKIARPSTIKINMYQAECSSKPEFTVHSFESSNGKLHIVLQEADRKARFVWLTEFPVGYEYALQSWLCCGIFNLSSPKLVVNLNVL